MRVEIDGQDVSRYPGLSAVVDQEVGQRSTATVGLALVEGAELPSGGQPSDFDRVRIEHPRQPYRSVALGLSPWLYWPLDDGPGQSAADDISGSGRPGTWSTGAADVVRRAILAETAPVPYGAAPWIGDANPAIESDEDTSAIGVAVTVALFLRIDTAAAGTQNILNNRSGGAGLRLRRVRIDANTQRLEWRVGSQTVTRTVSAGQWLLVIARRSATLMSLRVDDAETDRVTAAQTSSAGTSQRP